ncbi:hypothetical protein, partial [Enterococcus faecium]|uniref:hypothetical protein n=1 Tax=Enterococcus faecium TaxID=1352 RepID=UPI000CF05003
VVVAPSEKQTCPSDFLLPQMQAFEYRLFGIRGCDKAFVTAPYFCCTFSLQYFLIPPEYYFL